MGRRDDVAVPLAVQLHRRLRRAIVEGRYPQGSVLHETRLATELDVSRVPVREALPLLAHEGFIEVTPRRSAVVATWTDQRVDNVFDTRVALESAAAARAARRVAAGAEPADLEAAVAAAEAQLEADDDEFVQAEANCAIHLALVAAAGNELMDSVMRAVGGRMTWLFYLTANRDLHRQSDEHAAILDAVRAGNDRLAETLTYSHIESGRVPTLTALRAGRNSL